MSALKRLDQMRLQNKRYKTNFAQNLYPLLCKEDLWIFVKKSQSLYKIYENTIDEQSDILNRFFFFKNQTQLIQKPDSTFKNIEKKCMRKYLLCEAILITFDFCQDFSSYSFLLYNKKNQNSHIALEHIGKNWKSVQWIIQADFQNCQGRFKDFEDLLQKRIQDTVFLRLVISIFKTKQISSSDICFHITTTQFCVFLSNIYFYELDTLLFWTKHENKKIESQLIPSIFQNISKDFSTRKQDVLKHFVAKLVYVRHGGSWIIATNGPISFVKALFFKTHQFLDERLMLKLKVNQVQVTNVYAKSVSFVGYKIERNENFDLQFELPLDKILMSLSLEGFCNKSGQPMPKKEWASEPDWFIVSTFNKILFEIRNYWGPSFNQEVVQRIQHMLYISCAKTIAHKHRTTASQIFRNYDKALAINHPSHNNAHIKVIFKKTDKSSWVQPRRHLTQYDLFSNIGLRLFENRGTQKKVSNSIRNG